MDDIIAKTKNLINTFEESELIKNLEYYKSKVVVNKKLLELIKNYNSTDDDYLKLSLKQKIYNYPEYTSYMEYYNELFHYILIINRKFREYTNVRGCK